MNSADARALFEQFAAAVAYVAVRSPEGREGIGTATHVGDGVFVTARHVVEHNEILDVSSTEKKYVRLPDDAGARTFVVLDGERYPAHTVMNTSISIEDPPVLHSDDRIDLAAFRAVDLDPLTPWVPLGGHLDDWLGASDFVLREAIVMGYPPIPFSLRPSLIVSRAEVNGQVKLRDAPPVHFLLSAVARGGYSGALAIDEGGFALGLVSRSLGEGGPPELGFMTAISVDPIYEMLAGAQMLSAAQTEPFDGLWDSKGTEAAAQ